MNATPLGRCMAACALGNESHEKRVSYNRLTQQQILRISMTYLDGVEAHEGVIYPVESSLSDLKAYP
jgi:hypothetical protein